MDKIRQLVKKFEFFGYSILFSLMPASVYAAHGGPPSQHTPVPRLPTTGTEQDVVVDPAQIGFGIPTFGEILTFLIRFFFVIAGIAALIMLLWGALAWVTSGGEKEGVENARDKIINAIIGVILIVVTLSIIWSLENIVFDRRICFGLSCPVTLPKLLD